MKTTQKTLMNIRTAIKKQKLKVLKEHEKLINLELKRIKIYENLSS